MRIDIPSLGFGGAPLGNMFREVGDADARATLEAAWDAGIRLYDTSPHYGAGLSERRFAEVLADKPRDDFVLCSKVGRLLEPADRPENAPPFVNELPFKRVLDYSADGARRSIEASLERLKTASIWSGSTICPRTSMARPGATTSPRPCRVRPRPSPRCARKG